MSERNQRKDRKCLHCKAVLFGKATVLKEHAKACKQVAVDAAAEAIMQKLQQEMSQPVPGVL